MEPMATIPKTTGKLSDLNLLDIGHSIQLTGAIYSGNGKHYLCYFPDEAGNEDPVERLDLNKDDWTTFIRQTDLLETEIIAANPENGQLVKTIIRKSQRQIEQGVSWNVYRRDSYTCRYCGRNDVPLTVDHLVLWEEGGPSTEENLVSACRKCNRTRGNLPYTEWMTYPYYLKVSRNISRDLQFRNTELIRTLPNIPRIVHKRAR